MIWVKDQVEKILDTSEGRVRLLYNRVDKKVLATLLLGHGAGGGPEAMDLIAVADALGERRIRVIRVEMPWRLAGRKIAPRPEVLDRQWEAVVDELRTRSPIIFGGRSAGARVACRTARRLGAIGVVALAFPLHPPGKPAKTRSAELIDAGVPTLVVQGERDPFGTPYELPPGTEVEVIPGGTHDFRVPKKGDLSQDEALAMIGESVGDWIVRLMNRRESS